MVTAYEMDLMSQNYKKEKVMQTAKAVFVDAPAQLLVGFVWTILFLVIFFPFVLIGLMTLSVTPGWLILSVVAFVLINCITAVWID